MSRTQVVGHGVSSDNTLCGQRSQQKNCLVSRIFWGLSCLFCHGEIIGFFSHCYTAIAWPIQVMQSLYSNVSSVRQILGTKRNALSSLQEAEENFSFAQPSSSIHSSFLPPLYTFLNQRIVILEISHLCGLIRVVSEVFFFFVRLIRSLI